MMLSDFSPQPLSNNHSQNSSPSSLLNSSNDILSNLLQYNSQCPSSKLANNLTKLRVMENIQDEAQKPSQSFHDYFVVQPDQGIRMEEAGAGNSLFLAISRALLYKLYFRDHSFDNVMRTEYFNDLDRMESFRFDSDLALQEILRKKLCGFWLKSLRTPYSLNYTKYQFDFKTIYDFVYQVYQIGVSNFAHNRLFRLHALQDLASILKHKIYVFQKSSSTAEYNCTVYKPSEPVRDSIFLDYSETDRVKFKWLMPIYSRTFIQNNLLNIANNDRVFLKLNPLYQCRLLVISHAEFNHCFGDQIYKDLNTLLFIIFLAECPVHLLVSVTNLEFDSVKSSQDMVDFLNSIWGQRYFSLKEAKMRMEYLNYKRTNNERTNIETMDQTKKFKEQYIQETEGQMRTPKLAALFSASHNLPPISPSNLKRKPNRNSPVNTSYTPISQQTKKFYSPQLNQVKHQQTELNSKHTIVTSFNRPVQKCVQSQKQEASDDAVKPIIRKKKIITELTTSRRKSCHGITLHL